MKKVFILIICMLAAISMLSGCIAINFNPGSPRGITGKGTPVKYNFEVGEIRKISVEMYCDIIYYSAPSDTVSLEIHPNLMEYISVEERNGILTVKTTRQNISWSGHAPVLTVSTPALAEVSLMGAGTFKANDMIKADSLMLQLGGAGVGSADVNVSDLHILLAGAGEFELSGSADTARFNLAGAGRVEALDLQTRSADVNIAGVGSIRLSCSEKLSITAGGVGTVEYRGSPSLDLTRGGLVSIKQLS